MLIDYRKKAEEFTNPGYQNQLSDLKANYDRIVQQSKDNTQVSQNNYSNQVLGRGLGRSSIATTGLAGIQDAGNKILNNVELDHTRELTKLDNNREMQMQDLMDRWEQRDKQEDLERQRIAYSRGSGQNSSPNNKGNDIISMAWQEFQRQNQSGNDYNWLKSNAETLKRDIGTTEYNKMLAAFYEDVRKRQQASALASKIRME